MTWYKDRDFNEVKMQHHNEPTEIVAVIEDPKQLQRVIELYNEAFQARAMAQAEVETWKDRAEINGKRAFEIQDERDAYRECLETYYSRKSSNWYSDLVSGEGVRFHDGGDSVDGYDHADEVLARFERRE